VESTNGPIGSNGRVAPRSRALEDDQALADRDSDQASSDSDFVQGGGRSVHGFTRDVRDRTAQRRRQTVQGRVEAAAARDALARARDLAALDRDQAAAVRDRELAARDNIWADDGRAVTGAEILLRAAAENRRRAATYRAAEVEGRAGAAADREQASRDREQAADDRLHASADRDALLDHLAISEIDALTGTRTRAAGLADLDHEIDRARRTSAMLVVAYVDVVGLKAINDARGQASGDALLQRAVRVIGGQLRSYDLIVRLGGDEFLCVMSGATIQDARQRFGAVQAALAADFDQCEIKVGFAALAPEDRAAELIERADAELPTSRGR
jgi:diguanylate cyclase (GGDEF)-like protein